MILQTHSYYSLRYGTLSVEHLLQLAVEKEYKKFVLTDINNTTGAIDFVKQCKELGIEPILGVDIRNEDALMYLLIAKNEKGLYSINHFLSEHHLAKKPYPEIPPFLDEVFIIYPFEKVPNKELAASEFIGVQRNQLNRLTFSSLAKKKEKLLMLQNVVFETKEEYNLHHHLRAIDHNCLLSMLKEDEQAGINDDFPSQDKLEYYFSDFPELIENTKALLGNCSMDFDFKSVKNKATFTGNRIDDKALLKKLAYDGFKYRYRPDNLEAESRLRHELEIIDNLGFSAYFLITWDVIRYSMSRGFYHVGRGSGANSVVAYCLKITDVDPIELDLYFERFLNPKRTSPPDFDIDYSWKERDDVIDYIFKRYGREHTALLGTISTFKGKSIYRELGKVFGLPKEEIDRLIKYPNDNQNRNEITDKMHQLAALMKDFPNSRSIHAGGILISEKPINYYGALDLPPKGFPTIQWDMYVAEDIGFEKLDILSQRGIGHIKEAAEIILENRKINVDVHAIQEFKRDKKVKKQLQKGDTIGCFYVESPAMRGLLKKLHCDNYLSLVAASSIIRPGVAKSGMMRAYIQRFHKPESIEYLHPVMEAQLKETYGVMVYQEDVLKVCHHFAGLDLADADVLRRAMSGKYRSKSEFQRIVDRFFSNCKERGYSNELTKEVWRQIESFAGYSFSKAHSASYAVESFQSLYLKAHYPLEFITAVINNFGGFYHSWVYFNEAKTAGADVQLPCVNHSNYKTRLIEKTIYVGFIHIQSLEASLGKAIQKEREARGVFLDLPDFVQRMQIGKEQMVLLIRVGAFQFTSKPKAALLWDMQLFFNKSQKQSPGQALFNPPVKDYRLPDFDFSLLEDAYDEIELIGFPISMNSFDLLQTSFRGDMLAKDLMENVGKRVRMIGNLVTYKNVRTVRKELMHFGTFLDKAGQFFDTVNFPISLKKYPFRGYGLYLILGKVVEEFGFPSIEVEKMARLAIKEDPRG
ncbi:MAG: DNA polymerase III subunit alpha [Bacteroidales bacterium]|jgi:DNA-directed DNA polymerase III PolC|nr:DNA polymerase III subunit alpha [Bacteroidales bacterium]